MGKHVGTQDRKKHAHHNSAEEINDASTTLPKSIMTGVIVNSILGFVMAITISFTLGDITNILATPTGYPFIQMYVLATPGCIKMPGVDFQSAFTTQRTVTPAQTPWLQW